DGELYKETKQAEALKITSEARSYELATIAQVIAEHGKATIDYDVAIKQVKAMSDIGSSESTKSVILPTNITESLGTIETVLEYLRDRGSASSTKPDSNAEMENQVQKDPPAKDPGNSSDDQASD
ncbi:hypothetical protein N9448_08745, partial [Litorivicinus sp.]|nr:hypothetical protein [Litorivicinus sp.]